MMAIDAAEANIHLVPAVHRAVCLLQSLSQARAPRGISELARELALNKATVRDILLTLEHHGLVERDAATARFSVGHGLYAFVATRAPGDLAAVARPCLRELVERTGETALLTVPDGERMVIVAVEEPSSALKISAPVGQRLPAFAGAPAKVLLATRGHTAGAARLPAALRRFTERTIVEPSAYRSELERVREQGYAVDDEEYLAGVRAASAAVWGIGGEMLGALTVVGFSTRLVPERLSLAVDAVVELAAVVSRRLGGSRPQSVGAGSGQVGGSVPRRGKLAQRARTGEG